MMNVLFDYQTFAKELSVPVEIIQKYEKEAHDEFPYDNMLMEIHVLRALKAYVKTPVQVITSEN